MNPREAIQRLTAAFPSPVQTSETLRLYLEKLGQVRAEDLAGAVDWAVEHCPYWPRLSELLGRARTVAAARRIRAEDADRRARSASVEDGQDFFARMDGATEMPRGFRHPTGCQTLVGETWTPDELIDPRTGRIGLENGIHARARAAMLDLLEQRHAEHAARRSA